MVALNMYLYSIDNESRVEPVQLHFNIGTQVPTEGATYSFHVGELRLFRRLNYKGYSMEPFIPTRRILLVFPCCVSSAESNKLQRATLVPGAAEKISNFLSFLSQKGNPNGASGPKVSSGNNAQTASDGCNHFTIEDAIMCTTSGNAALLLECESLECALHLLEKTSAIECQNESMMMTRLFIRGWPCDHISSYKDRAGATCPNDLGGLGTENEALLRTAVLQDYYYIPTCVLCNDRLDRGLSGTSASSDAPLCLCSVRGEPCCCIQDSLCTMCYYLLHSCRHEDATESASAAPGASKGALLRCEECGKSGDPWVCLICGFVGCSRYQAMHAKDHYTLAQHYFSINVMTQQIWDYAGDAFVHRMVILVNAETGVMTRVQFPDRTIQDYENEDGAPRCGDESMTPLALTRTPLQPPPPSTDEEEGRGRPALLPTSLLEEGDAGRGRSAKGQGRAPRHGDSPSSQDSRDASSSDSSTCPRRGSDAFAGGRVGRERFSPPHSSTRHPHLLKGSACKGKTCFEIKTVSGKFDTKLTKANTYAMYATVIKNELDTQRQRFEEVLHRQDRSNFFTEGVPTALTMTMAAAASASSASVSAVASTTSSPYAAMTALDDAPNCLYQNRAENADTYALFLKLQTLLAKTHEYEKKEALLLSEKHELEQKLRQLVQENVKQDMQQNLQIKELNDTLKEIDLNKRTQAQLQRRLGNDVVQQMALLGGAGSNTGSHARRKGK